MEAEIVTVPEETEVEMHGEECPYCHDIIPLGTVAGHMAGCKQRPIEKIVEKTIIKEIVKESPSQPWTTPQRPTRPYDRYTTWVYNGHRTTTAGYAQTSNTLSDVHCPYTRA